MLSDGDKNGLQSLIKLWFIDKPVATSQEQMHKIAFATRKLHQKGLMDDNHYNLLMDLVSLSEDFEQLLKTLGIRVFVVDGIIIDIIPIDQ